jgi:hypothetical protein
MYFVILWLSFEKKDNRTSNNLQNTTKKTKHKLYIKPGQGAEGEPRCSGMVSNSCSTEATINLFMSKITHDFWLCLTGPHYTGVMLAVQFTCTNKY